MTTMPEILAATDLSAPSRHAVDRAFSIAAESGARLRLMHVLKQSALDALRKMLGRQAEAVERYLIDEAYKTLAELAAEPEHNLGVSAAVQVVAGAPLHAIVERADAINASLLVTGARGEGLLRHLLPGSTVSRLLRMARCPVLVVKQAPREAYRRLLVPIDFSPASRLSLTLARTVAPNASIVLMHVFEVPFEGKLAHAGVEQEVINHYRVKAKQKAQQALRALTEDAGLKPEEVLLLVAHGDIPQQILEQEQEQDCDLIIMGKHGDTRLEEFLLGSVTKHVIVESQCDVLVVNDSRQRHDDNGNRDPARIRT